jgi:Phospholipase_D-nuclease N-terminal
MELLFMEFLSIGIVLFILLLPFTAFILMLIACTHIATGKFEGNDKLVWLLLAIFIPLFGPVVYFIFGRKQRLKH